jgi:hypothetical protein
MTEIRNVPAARTELHDTRYGELLFATPGENAITGRGVDHLHPQRVPGRAVGPH